MLQKSVASELALADGAKGYRGYKCSLIPVTILRGKSGSTKKYFKLRQNTVCMTVYGHEQWTFGGHPPLYPVHNSIPLCKGPGPGKSNLFLPITVLINSNPFTVTRRCNQAGYFLLLI